MSPQNYRLQHVLGFQPEDLAANRAGHGGAQQRARIETSNLQTLLGGVFFGALLVGFFILVARIVRRHRVRNHNTGSSKSTTTGTIAFR